MSKHTPGPWHITWHISADERHFGLNIIRAASVDPQVSGVPIAQAVSIEDGQLIAAAPELLATLKETTAAASTLLLLVDKSAALSPSDRQQMKQQMKQFEGFIGRAQTAIAKAEAQS